MNFIDEYHLTIMPVILGSGIPLFADGNPTTLIKFQNAKEVNGVIDVVYSTRIK